MKPLYWLKLWMLAMLVFVSSAAAQTDNPMVEVSYYRGPHISFHVGSTHPLQDLDSLADANIHARLNLDYAFTTYLRLMLMLGINQFTAESYLNIEHPRWSNISLNCKALFPSPSGTPLMYYIQAGCGYYLPKTGNNEIGLNIGAGWQIPLGAPFSLEFGLDYHHIFTDDPTQFLTWQLGVLFR